jgi:hypothetical protein
MKRSLVPCALALLSWSAGCVKAEKSANPLGPSVAGPIPGVSIEAPTPLEPAQGSRIAVDQQPITLVIQNATTTGVRPLNYDFEIAADPGFVRRVFVREGISPGQNGRTTLRLPDPLATGRAYYWRARAKDGANTGPYSFTVLFNVFTPIVIGQAVALAPAGSIAELGPRFSIGNAPRSGPVGPITYIIELASDDVFANKLAIWQVAEQPGQTNLESPATLPANQQFYWHVRAADPTTSGPWSGTQAFRTPNLVIPSPSVPGTPCGPPYPTTPLGIVQCRRSQWSIIPHDQLVNFLRGVALDLNAAGVAGGPFGLLRKQGGTNCSGYSCDVLCAGQGNDQRQWDVLGDVEGAQTPAWIGPNVVPNIRVDICEIQ